jgi:hypothetical protein
VRFGALLALVASGCSFVAVRGPGQRVGLLPEDPAQLRCSEDSLFPSLDALGGAAAIAVAGGGIVLEQTSEDGKPENFTKYYAAPLVALAIVYFISASYGNNRITWCSEAKERITKARDGVRPVDLGPPTPKKKPSQVPPDDDEIEIETPKKK